MGLFGKIKNIFYDEEIVEVPVDEKRQEVQPRIEEVRIPKREEPVIRQEIPSFKIEEPQREIREPERPKSVAPIYTERDLFKTQPSFKFPVIDEEDEEPVIRREEPKPRTRSSILDYDMRPTRREPERKPEYKIPNKANNSSSSRSYGSHNPNNNSERTFKPSPVISPVYGVLDKNYTKEEIRQRNEYVRHNPSDMNVDSVRRKAFGTLEDELENTLSKISEKPKEEKSSVTSPSALEDTKSIEDLLNEIEGNRNMSIGEVEEQYKDKLEEDDTSDFGFNFKVEGHENIKEEVNDEDNSSLLDDFKTRFESNEEVVQEEPKEEGFEKTLEHDLFNLIDSMYEEREGE